MSTQKIDPKLVQPAYEQLPSLALNKPITVADLGPDNKTVHRYFFIQEQPQQTCTGIRVRARETGQRTARQLTICPGGVVVIGV